MGEKQELMMEVLSDGRLSSLDSNILMYVYTTISGYLEYMEGRRENKR